MGLRKYQQDCVDELFKYWAKCTKPCLIQLATGAGKSHIIAEIASSLDAPVLVLQPTKEILEQNFAKLAAAGYDTRKISICSASAGSWKINKQGVTFATIGTIAKHLTNCQHFGTVIIDEVDCVPTEKPTSQYMTFLNGLPATTKIVGLSATPWRNVTYSTMFEDPKVYCRPMTRIPCRGGAKTRLGQWVWYKVIYRFGISDLQEMGYLAKTKYHVAETDWSFVRDVPGRVDYDTNDMMKWVDIEDNTSRFTQAVVWCMQKNLKTIIFTPSIDMNERLLKVVKALGGTAETMDSENDSRVSRTRKMNDFRQSKYQFLINVGMVGRGVDVPSVDCVMLCRPTKSLSLYMQFVGRCLRIDPDNPDKIAYVIDLSGNYERFGRVEDIKLVPLKASTDTGWNYEKETIIHTTPDGKQKIYDRVS